MHATKKINNSATTVQVSFVYHNATIALVHTSKKQTLFLRWRLDALSLEGHLGEFLHALRKVVVGEETRPGNEAVGPGGGAFANGFLRGLDPTVDLDVDVQVLVDDPLADLADLIGHGGDVFLSTESGVDRHDQHVVDHVQNVFDHFGGRVGVEGDRGGSTGGPDPSQGTMQVGAGLDVNNDNAGLPVGSLADLDEFFEHGVGAFLADHELRLEGHVGVLAAPLDGLRSKGQVGDKIPVHDIELDTIASGIFQSLAVFSELSEIGRQHGRNDLMDKRMHETTTNTYIQTIKMRMDARACNRKVCIPELYVYSPEPFEGHRRVSTC